MLEAWIREALAYVIANNDPYLTLDHFMLAQKVDSDRKMVAGEIEAGENFLCITGDSPYSIVPATPKPPKPRKRKPFEKKPLRHKINGRS